jgi:hypothetical protein
MTKISEISNNMFTTPLLKQYREGQVPDLSHEGVANVTKKIDSFVDSKSLEELSESIIMFWLTHALHFAINAGNAEAVHDICQIINKLIKKDSQTTVDMLSEIMEVGNYKGQSHVYSWVDELYSTTFTKDGASLVNLNYILSRILDEKTNDFITSLIEEIKVGKNTGMNAIVLIAQALLQSAREPYNQPSTTLIAQFLTEVIDKSPTVVRSILTTKINKKELSDKNIINLLANALEHSARDNDTVVQLICDEFIEIIKTHTPDYVDSSFNTIISKGPHEGLNSTHIILDSLISAAQTKDNDKTMVKLISVLIELYDKLPIDKRSIFIDNIKIGNKLNQNGVTMLSQALMSASENKLDTTPLFLLFNRLIEDFGPTNIQKALDTKSVFRTTTFLQMLENFCQRNINDRSNDVNIEAINNLLTEISSPLISDKKSDNIEHGSSSSTSSQVHSGGFFTSSDTTEKESPKEAHTTKNRREM